MVTGIQSQSLKSLSSNACYLDSNDDTQTLIGKCWAQKLVDFILCKGIGEEKFRSKNAELVGKTCSKNLLVTQAMCTMLTQNDSRKIILSTLENPGQLV